MIPGIEVAYISVSVYDLFRRSRPRDILAIYSIVVKII